MRQFLFILLFGLLFVACEQDSISPAFSGKNQSIDSRSPQDKVDVCHYSEEDGTWHVINVSLNALQAHLNHGDAVDMDGDGYFNQENGCSLVDCDDNDADEIGYEEIPCDGIDNDCDGDVDENINIALGGTATGSSYYLDRVPSEAIDGNYTEGWNSGGYPDKYITIDLGDIHPVSHLCLKVDQLPDCYTEHVVSFSEDGTSWSVVDEINGDTYHNQLITRSYTGQSARYIKVETFVSESWVAWFEIAVYE